ncbi:MAG: molybdopterin molybdotransferase MoeA [Bacteroidales bacterium]|nr:molybdopterin molybdotransferase MoeA [Bacteroidales bacterium]
MVLFEDALNTVLSQTNTIGNERVALPDSLWRVLAENIFSDTDMPPFDKSAVDGYACRTFVGAQNFVPQHFVPQLYIVPQQIIETIPAGTVPQKTIMPGQCSKIMTGAMVPPGADCVIMIEDTELAGDNIVRITREITGKNICYQGEDIKSGDLVLQKGVLISPAMVAVLATVGAVNPMVAQLPGIGVISTGDELVEPSVKPGLAKIRNSNAMQLVAQLKTVPALPTYYGIVADEGPEMRKIIELALEENDVALLTGGVSMGDFDFVPAVMREAGFEILFEKIAIRPGKPTVFGRRNNKFIFGLPGNPVSSFVLFEMLVKPFLRRMMGCDTTPVEFKLPMGIDFTRRKSDRKSLIPVVIKDGAVFPVEYHGSAHINAFTVALGIMILEIGTSNINKGENVDVRPL